MTARAGNATARDADAFGEPDFCNLVHASAVAGSDQACELDEPSSAGRPADARPVRRHGAVGGAADDDTHGANNRARGGVRMSRSGRFL